MRIKPELFLYAVSLFLLIHVQMNLHQFAFFVGGSIIVGMLPIRQAKWWKYALLQFAALTVCLLLNKPSAAVLDMVGSIAGTGGPGFIAAVVVFNTITMVLTTTTTYEIITKNLFRKYLTKKR